MAVTVKQRASTKKSATGKGKIGSQAGKSKAGQLKATRERVSLVKRPVAQEMLRLLCRNYPDAACELSYGNHFQLLVAVILSAQTTDNQVNKVSGKLFERFPTAALLAEAPLESVKEIIRPTGYYNHKAKNIRACASALVERFQGEVPDKLEELITLPGVGRKTANVVLGVAHGESAWSVDTHVQRLSHRLGFSRQTDPHKIELDLQRLFPDCDWSKYSITLIWHGRRLCFAKRPDCAHCPINHLCPSSLV